MRRKAYPAAARPQLLLLLSLLPCIYAAASVGSSGGGEGLNDDVLGLIVFKSSVEDPSSALATWDEDDDSPCTAWAYVQCSPATGRVVALSLDGLGLSGHLPSRGLEKLSELQSLSLSRNNLTGAIPSRLALLSSLRRLNLSHNLLSGVIPSVLPAVQVLDLSGNSLSGSIPESIFSENGSLCENLRVLDLSGNALEGKLPAGLAQCGLLLSLNLRGNRLAGNVDFVGSVYSLRRLCSLDLSDNAFSGGVPESFAVLHNLKELKLSRNGFTGAVPASIGLCPHLVSVDLSSNKFTGALPHSFQWLPALEYLNISGNSLTGDFPTWVGALRSLRVIDVSRNELTGSLPEEIGELKELSYLGAAENKLSGEIPARIAECGKLSMVKLRRNQYTGGIPSGLFDLGLEQLDLSSNALGGTIPAGSTRLFESLRSLDLSNNRLAGDIPPEMALYFNLRYLNLSWNDLRSRIPPELGYFRNLSVLDLRYSALYGQIPGDLCDSDSLAVLQLDGNSLSGPIPEEIGNCTSLHLLSLSHNNLNGTIPPTMGKLKKLVILNLEFNSLGGEIPAELAGLDSLLAANISHNRLVGRLPTGSVFPSLDQSALQGNLGLCSPLVAEPCIMNVPKPLVLDPNLYRDRSHGHDAAVIPQPNSRHKRLLSVSAIVAISAATLIVLGVLIVSLLNASVRRRMGLIERALEASCTSSSTAAAAAAKSGDPAVGRLVLFGPRSSLRAEDLAGGAESLLHKATEIGRGAIGTVYKATVDSRILAVKKLQTSSIVPSHEDFDRELRTLGKARHPNLMPIRGYYWTPELQLLISDFATGGNLHSRLHDRSNNPNPPLNWGQRFRIALGVAKGLAHLHHSFRPPIVHHGVKPSNVLLDADLNARIGDFGLAKLVMGGGRKAAGAVAVGYVAPEVACRSMRVSEKCDVYGFGVVVLELVTGRRAVEYGADEVEVLVEGLRAAVEGGGGAEWVDAGMGGEWPEEEVMPVIKLGLVCASQVPSSRPSMAEVVQILQVIRTPAPEKMEVF